MESVAPRFDLPVNHFPELDLSKIENEFDLILVLLVIG